MYAVEGLLPSREVLSPQCLQRWARPGSQGRRKGRACAGEVVAWCSVQHEALRN